MNNKKATITSNSLVFLLSIFIFLVLMFDYSMIYKVFLIILFFLTIIFNFNKKIKITRLNIVYLLFILYFLIHVLLGLSVNRELSMVYIYTMILNLIMCLTITIIVKDDNTIENVFKTFIISAFIMCIYILIMDYSNILSGELGKGVLKPFTNIAYSHNDISWVAAISIFFLSYFSLKKKPIKYSLFLKIFFLIFVILTGARKSLLLCAFGLIIYPYLFNNSGKSFGKKLVNIFVCFIVIVVSIFLFLKNQTLYNLIGNRFEGYYNVITNNGDGESSAVSRSIMKETAINKIKEKPFIGHGLNTFRTFNGSFGTWSHNNYLEIAVSGGMFAVILYYSIYLYFFIAMYKANRDNMINLFLCFMVYMLIHDFLSISYISRTILIIFCLIQCKIEIDKKERISFDKECL